MAMITENVREIDTRINDGLRIVLYWNPESDTMTVEAHDWPDHGPGDRFVDLTLTDIPKADAQKAFMHPFSYS